MSSKTFELAMELAKSYREHLAMNDSPRAGEDLRAIDDLVGSYEWDETAGKHVMVRPEPIQRAIDEANRFARFRAM